MTRLVDSYDKTCDLTILLSLSTLFFVKHTMIMTQWINHFTSLNIDLSYV